MMSMGEQIVAGIFLGVVFWHLVKMPEHHRLIERVVDRALARVWPRKDNRG